MNTTFGRKGGLYSALATDPELADIVSMFVAEMPERIAELTKRLDASDWEGLRRAAHQLKGAAGSYGFPAITAAARRVEEAARLPGPEEAVRRAVEELIEDCRRARPGPPGPNGR